MPEPFRRVLRRLPRHARALPAPDVRPADRLAPSRRSSDPSVRAAVHADLRHLIVDEYQDVNPAQERLIELLAEPHGTPSSCVVGDDDQAIYQWRGSDVDNIVDVRRRATRTSRQFELADQPALAGPGSSQLANRFAQTIPGRLAKADGPVPRRRTGRRSSLAVGSTTRQTEADAIATTIDATRTHSGVPYRDIAILVRGRGRLPDASSTRSSTSGSRSSPADAPACSTSPRPTLFGATFAGSTDIDWAPEPVRQARDDRPSTTCSTDYRAAFALDADALDALRRAPASQWQRRRSPRRDFDAEPRRRVLRAARLARRRRRGTSPTRSTRNRLGTLARFTAACSPTTSRSTRRSRRDADEPRRAGRRRRPAASGTTATSRCYSSTTRTAATTDFDGEEDLLADAVDSRHGPRRQGPRVAGRLPAVAHRRPLPVEQDRARAGLARPARPVRRRPATRARDADERRLFYVALTRARDWVSLSSHSNGSTKQARRPSPYLDEVADATGEPAPTLATPRRADRQRRSPDARDHLQRARRVPRLRAGATGCATSSASSRRSRPSSATATPSTT